MCASPGEGWRHRSSDMWCDRSPRSSSRQGEKPKTSTCPHTWCRRRVARKPFSGLDTGPKRPAPKTSSIHSRRSKRVQVVRPAHKSRADQQELCMAVSGCTPALPTQLQEAGDMQLPHVLAMESFLRSPDPEYRGIKEIKKNRRCGAHAAVPPASPRPCALATLKVPHRLEPKAVDALVRGAPPSVRLETRRGSLV